MNNKMKVAAIAVIVIGFIYGGISWTQNWGKNKETINTESAMKKLNSLYARLNVKKLTLKKDVTFQDINENAEIIAVLPDISEFPFIVNPRTDNFLTIYSSLEKADWLSDVANRFNQSGAAVDGEPISVAIRAIPSNLGADFISSGKYKPDVYSPSSEIYGSLLTGHGVSVNLADRRLAGNVSGVIISKKKSDELTQKYGELNGKTIINSVLNSELALGYTDPLSNEDGFNLILTLLSESDSSNPISDNAIANIRKFQDRILFIAYDYNQLKASLASNTMDAIVSNYQAYTNDLRSSYVFVPIGVRRDNPVYEIGDLTDLKKQITAEFVNFCANSDSQKKATDKGFNSYNDYAYAFAMNGVTIQHAKEIYKREKSGFSDITAVFVADISGSMEGSPLWNLKASLNRVIEVINPNVNIGLVTFSDNVNIAVPIAKFDNTQRSYFSNAIKSMSAGGGTAMYDAVVAAQKLLMDAKAQNPNTKIMLFVLTDGEVNRGLSFNDIESMTRDIKTPIYTIGYNADIEALRKLSDINEAATMNADSDNVIYRLESLFNAQM